MNMLALLLQEEGPDASLSWLLWVVLGLFLLIVLIGWWVSRNKAGQPVAQHETHVEPEAPAVPARSADDLIQLEGIGPKVAVVLNEAGIMSFADLAAADAAHVQQALNAAGMRYMDPAGWIEQAKLAANGDMEGLAKLQDQLKGGRRVS
jgi:predicted flap endonuclease-1-like 5' DNA nuclease